MANEQDRQQAQEGGPPSVPLAKASPRQPADSTPSLDKPRAAPIAEQPTLAAQQSLSQPSVPPVPRAPMPPPGANQAQAPQPGPGAPYAQQPQPQPQPYAQQPQPYAQPPQAPPQPYAQPQSGGYPQAQYGYPQAQQAGPYPPPGYGYPPGGGWHRPPVTGICTAAMVVGIISAALAVTLYGLVLTLFMGPIAVGLGISARRKVARGEAFGSGQATSGFVLGIITTAVSWALLTLAMIGFLVE